MAPGDDFISEICKIKHFNIDKDINNIKEDIDEIKNMIEQLSNDVKLSHLNLKNKIVLVNKSMGDKIDELNDFDKKLRGNGDPSIWELVRNIKRNIKIMMATIILILVLVLGGNYKGISLESIKRGVKTDSKEIKKVEAAPEIVKEVPKFTIPKK